MNVVFIIFSIGGYHLYVRFWRALEDMCEERQLVITDLVLGSIALTDSLLSLYTPELFIAKTYLKTRFFQEGTCFK